MLETLILPAGPAEGVVESLKPDVHVLETDDTYGKVAVEPLKRGFGLTIGNPLRRILLSSTNGSAVTWVKIEDVVHEYTAIPGVKEEVMELLLNIKRIRIRSQSDRAGKMRLEVTGEGLVCAGDISTSSDFEIVNPELHLATLDTPTSRLFIEFNVEQGVGYKQAVLNDQSESTPVGVLPVDAIFSPVTKVNFNVEMTRVGQVTDYERLVLEVWTDGTIKPVDAVREAAENLVDHFFLFSNLSKVIESGVERSPLALSPEIFQTPIDRLELSPRTLNCLKRAHITKVGEVLEMSDEDLLKIRNFGDKSLTELREKLAERGVGGPAGSESSLEDGAPENDEDDQDSPAIVAELSSAEGSISAQEIKDLLSAGDTPESTSDLPGDAVGWSTEDDSGEDGDDEDDKE
jgi:DNA-directed RNA polymerase subunit alpha